MPKSRLATNPKWRIASRNCGVELSVCVHIGVYLIDIASNARPKGSVDEFDIDECAVEIEQPPEVVQRVIAAFYEMGLIDNTTLTWGVQDPDPTSTERQRRFQANRRKAAENMPADIHAADIPDGTIQQNSPQELPEVKAGIQNRVKHIAMVRAFEQKVRALYGSCGVDAPITLNAQCKEWIDFGFHEEICMSVLRVAVPKGYPFAAMTDAIRVAQRQLTREAG